MLLLQTSEILGYNLRATKILHSNDSNLKLINITVVREGIPTFQTSDNVYNMAELFEPEVRIYVTFLICTLVMPEESCAG